LGRKKEKNQTDVGKQNEWQQLEKEEGREKKGLVSMKEI